MQEQNSGEHGPKPLVVGVTGAAGSGKSTVTRLLAALGAQTADADALVRWTYQDRRFQEALIRRFGRDVLNAEGGVNRSALAGVVFQDPDALADLEALVHPAVLSQIADLVQAYRRDPERAPILALEIPLLYETGAEAMVDRVLAVTASESVRTERLRQRGWDDERIRAVEQAQMPLAEKAARADDVLNTDVSLEETACQVEQYWDRVVAAQPPRAPAR